jgi:hypothetical protein
MSVMDKGMKIGIGLILVGLFFSAGLGYYVGALGSTSGSPGQTSTASSQTSSGGSSQTPYVLNLVITTSNVFNSSIGPQPAYYVVGTDGLLSSATISLPAHQLIEVIITNYDTGNATPFEPQFEHVMGTNNDTIQVINNALINSSEGPSGIMLNGTQTVSSLQASEISHTFTVPGLNLNIPVAANTTEVAFFTTGDAGNFEWNCMTPCGSGPSGVEGAMLTPGWMSGTIVVS